MQDQRDDGKRLTRIVNQRRESAFLVECARRASRITIGQSTRHQRDQTLDDLQTFAEIIVIEPLDFLPASTGLQQLRTIPIERLKPSLECGKPEEIAFLGEELPARPQTWQSAAFDPSLMSTWSAAQ